MKKKGITALLLAFSVFNLTACSSKGAPEKAEKIENVSKAESSEETEATSELNLDSTNSFKIMIEAAQSQIPSMMNQMGDMYSDLSISEGENNTIIYTYTYAQNQEMAVDTEALRPVMVKAMKPVIDSMKGLYPDIKLQTIFLNPDQSEVINFIITQEDTDQIEDSDQEAVSE